MTTYFITICAHMRRNLFQRDEVAELMVATFAKYRDAGEFELHEYVVMPNHVHLLISLNGQQRLGRVVQLIKGGFSHSLRNRGVAFPAVWQQRYYDRRVREADEFAEFSRYIRENPVRKGLAEQAEDYQFSSAGRVPGLKPRDPNKGGGDANLKVRSTVNTDTDVKVRSTVNTDTDIKVRSTVNTDTDVKVRSTVNEGRADAHLKVRSTVRSYELKNV